MHSMVLPRKVRRSPGALGVSLIAEPLKAKWVWLLCVAPL
jgi:hypothetical protein